jgi:phage gp36-like protein
MAAPYSTVEQFRSEEGAQRAISLLDVDDSGAEKPGQIDQFIEDADTDIDARLGGRFVVPFASLTSTPKQIQKLSLYGALAQAYERLAPSSKDAAKWRKRFDDAADRYRKGEWVIPGAPLITDTATAARPMTYESAGTTFAGRIDDDYSEDGVDKLNGF